ncbi:pentapeptide repeat-containing protein [Hellea balneolensis]|uniref:pentapeptide repeat-containing protein n=1 Tax=Hellea balneolensis TaxID=287478 RepID=UPI00041208AD|nr:pentapeptide repeat-containing protein [Hellea balneolensis]
MIRDFTTKFALGFAAIALFTLPASAQIRVDARIHSSAGSCSQCDLSNKRMNGVKLKNANFSGSIFNNSNLSGGNFDGSNLTGSHFRKALLYSVEGQNVNLNGADLQDATLTEANLGESVFIGSNFRRADLTRAKLQGGDFRQTSFQRATATDANFQNGNFVGAKLDHINLNKAILDGGNFKGVTFGNAIMLDATMMASDLSDADLSMTQGLKQEQLNAACGNMNTKLPYGLSIPYCEGTLTAEAKHDHSGLDPEMAKAAKRLERAIEDVEIILKATPTSNRPLRRKLQSIHSDLVNSKRVIER